MAKQPIEMMMDSAVWEAVPHENDGSIDDLPFATHKGKLTIGEIVLDVVQLNTGERLITEESLVRFFEGLED